MIKFLLFFLCILSSCYGKNKYELSICCIFRDDAKYLPEWIEFHKKQGVQHFYLYDNLSSDYPKKILKPYYDDVTLIDWPYESIGQEDWNVIQCNSYMHCVKNCHSKWIAFLDTDEFLFCPDKTNLRRFLRHYADNGSISAYWRMYGTSNISVPKKEHMIDHLVYRANDDNPAHKIMKTICQRKYVENIVNPHFVILNNGKIDVLLPVNLIRINHYWSRDLNFFHNIKLPRREKWYNDRKLQIEMEKSFNEIYDPILSNSRG